jgi:hypothetical protein
VLVLQSDWHRLALIGTGYSKKVRVLACNPLPTPLRFIECLRWDFNQLLEIRSPAGPWRMLKTFGPPRKRHRDAFHFGVTNFYATEGTGVSPPF